MKCLIIHDLTFKMDHEVLVFGRTFWKMNVGAINVVVKVLFLRSPCYVCVGSVRKDLNPHEGYVQ